MAPTGFPIEKILRTLAAPMRGILFLPTARNSPHTNFKPTGLGATGVFRPVGLPSFGSKHTSNYTTTYILVTHMI